MLIAGRIEQLDQAAGELGIIAEFAVDACPARKITAVEPAIGFAHLGPDEVGRLCRCLDVARLAQHMAGAGEAGDGEAVPADQDLFIADRLDP